MDEMPPMHYEGSILLYTSDPNAAQFRAAFSFWFLLFASHHGVRTGIAAALTRFCH
jgi:hypothetical protein